MSETPELTRAAIAAVDPTGQLADVLDFPEHLRDALWRVESAGIAAQDCPGGLIVAGMGGSAIGGALARAALADQASRPILAASGYGLPSWTTPDTSVSRRVASAAPARNVSSRRKTWQRPRGASVAPVTSQA